MSRHSGRAQQAAAVRRGGLRPGFTGTLRWESHAGRFRDGRLVGYEMDRPHTRPGPPPTRQAVVEGLYRALAARKGATHG